MASPRPGRARKEQLVNPFQRWFIYATALFSLPVTLLILTPVLLIVAIYHEFE